jgi:hypothetical protein
MSFIRTNIHNFVTMTMLTTGDNMREISLGQSKITNRTVTPFPIWIKICPCAYRTRGQMGDV